MTRLLITVVTLASAVAAQGWPLPPTQTGNLYISGYSSANVGEYLPDGTLLRTLTHPTMTNPRGVAVDDDGNLIVVVQTNSRILRLAPDGTHLQTVTHPDLTSGTGISRAPNGNWYVGSFSPGRVVVFDAAWNYVTTITAAGMNGVNCVSFETSGTGAFAVTSAGANLVYRFDATHTMVGTVGHPNMSSPMSIASDGQGARFVSNGSSGWIIKFDAAWNPLLSFGQGTLSAPQGIAVDQFGDLTISNFGASTVHRYDTQGALLGSWPLVGVTTGRNMAWQTSPRVLSRAGTVGLGAAVIPEDVLLVSGQAGDAMRRGFLTQSAAFDLTLSAPTGTAIPAHFVLYAFLGEPVLGDVTDVTNGIGSMCFAPPLFGGAPIVIANTIGAESLLGTPIFLASPAPSTVLSYPTGFGVPATVTIQGVILDTNSAAGPGVAWSVTNAVTVQIS